MTDTIEETRPMSRGNFSLALHQNATVLIPLDVPPGTHIRGNLSYGGPYHKGFTLAYFGPTGPKNGFTHLNAGWQAPEYSQSKESRSSDGTYRELCLSGRERTTRADPLCEIYVRPTTMVLDFPIEQFPLPTGIGYLFLAAEFEGELVLNLQFSKETTITTPLEFESRTTRLGVESFDSPDEHIDRCGNVFWCGNLAQGSWKFPNLAGREGLYNGFGYISPGAAGDHCVTATTGESKCAEKKFFDGGYSILLEAFIGSDGPWDSLSFNGTGLPATGLPPNRVGHFSFRGILHEFQTPETHPLASTI